MQLLDHPACHGVGSHVEVNGAPPSVVDREPDVQQLEMHGDERASLATHRCDALKVVRSSRIAGSMIALFADDDAPC